MITSKKLRLLLGALCVTGGLMVASAQPAVHPKSYYDEITYEWTDASNVTHTSAITEEATDPYQIVALLKKVYCDPRLPGPTYTAYKANGTRENEVYYGSQAGGWNISNSDVTKPYEDGYTMLMVSVKNDPLTVQNDDYGQMFTTTNQLVNYFRNNVTSVLLLTDGLRIGEGERAGTVFNISGYYNRFFMISKGQSRKKNYSNEVERGEQPPFKQMFEELSPTTGDENVEIKNFYWNMIDGASYPVIHDCASVIENKHFFSMDGIKGTEYRSLTGLNIFMPDYRMKYFANGNYDGRTMNPTGSTWKATFTQYNQDYAPTVGLYNIKLGAEAVKAAEEHTYNVELTWTSSLDEMAHGTVPQNYIVYIVEPGPDGAPTYRKIGETTETHFTDVVEQDEFSSTYTYIVFGQPNDGEHDMFVAWSNDASVFIPGWHDFVELHVEHFESDYNMGQECNYYRNFLTIANADPENGLTTDRLADENSFTLYRFDATNPDAEIPVLDLKLTRNSYGNTVNYTISYGDYNSQTPTPGYNVNVVTSGNLSVSQGNLINLEGIKFVDQFYASTVNDAHPTIYGYVLKLNNAELNKQSNVATVYVMKSSSAPKGYYTLDQVMNDVDGTLETNIKSGDLTMNLINLPDVYHYTIERGNGTMPNENALTLQRNGDGSFEDMATANNYPNGTFMYHDVMATGNPGDYMTYVPIIWLRGEDRVAKDGKENSYGAPIWKTGVGNIEMMIGGTRATGVYGEFVDFDWNKCAIFNPIFTINGIVPTNTNIEYEPFMYRIWRNCNDLRSYFYNDEGKPLFWPYDTPNSKELIVEEMTTQDKITAGNEFDELAFGATVNANIEFVVRFYYKVVGANFTRNLNDDEPLYYVVELRMPWENIPTGVAEINTSDEVSKTYYNAQGVKSDKPFDGVNIVITRYSDGSTKTTKVVR